MADVTRPTGTFGQPSTEKTRSTISPANQDFLAHSGAVAGEAVDAGQPVYRHSDGAYYKSDANSGTAADKNFSGLVCKYAAAGKPVTVMYQGHMGGYVGLTPGAWYYVSNTEGEIADAPGTTFLPVGVALNAGTLLVLPFGKILADVIALATA